MLKTISLVACSLAAALMTQQAAAADFPQKRMEFVVAFGPGGGTDVIARAVSSALQAKWGQPVVVENRVGAEGVIGAAAVAKAKPDGYTMMWTTNAHTMTAALKKAPYDAIGDFTPVTLVAQSPHVLAIHPSVPATDMAQLVEYCRANPGKLRFGSSGQGTTAVVLARQVIKLSGCQATIVPYKGSGDSTAALLGNEIQVLFSSPGALLPHLRDKRVRAIATDLPLKSEHNLPTIDKTPGFEDFKPAPLWYGILAPAGTPEEVVTKVRNDILEVVGQPQVQKILTDRGMTGVVNTPVEFKASIQKEINNWTALLSEN